MDREDVLTYIVVETLKRARVDGGEIVRTAHRIIAGLRQELGGDRYYIPKTAPILDAEDERRHRIVKDALTPMSTADVQRAHGVSRSTIYRLVKRYATRKG
jgi:Mor family transcriptional regulator